MYVTELSFVSSGLRERDVQLVEELKNRRKELLAEKDKLDKAVEARTADMDVCVAKQMDSEFGDVKKHLTSAFDKLKLKSEVELNVTVVSWIIQLEFILSVSDSGYSPDEMEYKLSLKANEEVCIHLKELEELNASLDTVKQQLVDVQVAIQQQLLGGD